MVPVEGFGPPTYWLQISRSTSWAKPAYVQSAVLEESFLPMDFYSSGGCLRRQSRNQYTRRYINKFAYQVWSRRFLRTQQEVYWIHEESDTEFHAHSYRQKDGGAIQSRTACATAWHIVTHKGFTVPSQEMSPEFSFISLSNSFVFK